MWGLVVFATLLAVVIASAIAIRSSRYRALQLMRDELEYTLAKSERIARRNREEVGVVGDEFASVQLEGDANQRRLEHEIALAKEDAESAMFVIDRAIAQIDTGAHQRAELVEQLKNRSREIKSAMAQISLRVVEAKAMLEQQKKKALLERDEEDGKDDGKGDGKDAR